MTASPSASLPDPRMRSWLRSFDLRSDAGRANWRCSDMLGGQHLIEIDWNDDSCWARRSVTMPGEEARVQWQVRLVRERNRWRCEDASHNFGVRGWRAFIREEVRQTAVAPQQDEPAPRRRLSGLA